VLRSTLKFAAGAAIAITLWMVATPQYNALLAGIVEKIVHGDPRLRNVEVVAHGRRVIARGDGTEAGVPAVVIPADQLTYNVILLVGLFATNRAPLRDRGAARLALALAILVSTHVVALAVAMEATFATKTAEWGSQRYGPLEQDFWSALEYGYRLFGMFAVAFGCWWLTRVSGPSEGRRSRG
jgi:hypothetical protein